MQVNYTEHPEPKSRSTIVNCCFPQCKNFGRKFLPYAKVKRSNENRDKFRMYKVNVDKSHLAYCNRMYSWLPRIGLTVKDVGRLGDLYLCDGHFSLRQYTLQAQGINFRLKSTSVPDILEPSPPSTLWRALNKLANGGQVDVNTDLRTSQVVGVPTEYNVKIKPGGGERDQLDRLPDDLKITVRYKVCCLCALPVTDDKASPLVDTAFQACTDLGRVISLLSGITETPILSGYACNVCQNIVLSCFHRLVEINTKLILAQRRLDDSLCIGALPPELPCHACSHVLTTHAEYKDHLIEHALDRKGRTCEIQTIVPPDNLEEGELCEVTLASVVGADDKLPMDHDYIRPEEEIFYGENGIQVGNIVLGCLCDICGVVVEKSKFSQHKTIHKRKSQLSATAVCPVCEKVVNKCTLISHVRRHDENFVEPSSKMQRKSSFALKTAFYACQVCGERLKTLEERDEHKVTVHGLKKRNNPRCYYCDYKGRSTTYLKNHLKKEHPEKCIARCEPCNVDFYHENAMLIHNALKHPDLHRSYMEQKKKLLMTTASIESEKKRADMLARIRAFSDDSAYSQDTEYATEDSPESQEIATDAITNNVTIDTDSEGSQAIMYIEDMDYYMTAEDGVIQVPSGESVIVPAGGTWHTSTPLTITEADSIQESTNEEFAEESILYETAVEQSIQRYEWSGSESILHNTENLDPTDEDNVEYMEPCSEYFVFEGNTVTKYLHIGT